MRIEYDFSQLKGQEVKKILMAGCLLLVVVGCAKLEHLDQLLTLKDLSEEGDRQDRYVENQDHKFELLLEAVQSNALSQDTHQKKILQKFGDPIYREEITRDGQGVEKWLYRYTKEFFDSEKVYLYFDREGKLINWEYLPERK